MNHNTTKDHYHITGASGNTSLLIDQVLPTASTNNVFSFCRGAGVLSIVALSVAGSGAVSPKTISDLPVMTGSTPQLPNRAGDRGIGGHRQEVLTFGERVERAKSILGLKTTEVAAILGVERQTIYSWTSGQTEPQARNRHRIEALCDLAQRWSALTGKPVRRYLHHQVEDQGSLFEMMCAETIDSEAIHVVLRDVSEKLKTEVPRVSRESITLLDGAQVEWLTGT